MKTILIITLVFSFICIFIIKFWWVNTPEWWEFGEETGSVLFDLSVGYISAFIFYLITIWIPEIQRHKKVKERLSVPLSRLLYNMKEPIFFIQKNYGDNFKDFYELEENSFIKSVEKTDLINDEGPLYLFNVSRNATLGECLYNYSTSVDKYIDDIYKIPVELDIKLVELLDDINKSIYHETLKSMNSLSGFNNKMHNIKGKVIDKALFEYYCNFIALKKYMQSNKIQITIEEL